MQRFFEKYGGIIIVVAALGLYIVGYFERTIWPAEKPVEGPPPFLRLHVLANSDSERDQELKLAVRDLVLAELNTPIRQLEDFSEVIPAVEEELPRLQERIGQYLAAKQCGYTSEIKVGVERMPAVSYGFLLLPEGDYWALKVTLGEGKGKNWWCVLFPPLCFLDLNDPEAVTVLAEEKKVPAVEPEENPWQDWQDSVVREMKKIWLSQ